MENIVITDGYTLNPGDLSWKEFESLGKVSLFDRTSEGEISKRCEGATIIVTNKTPIHAGLIASLPQLKAIAVTATGFNVVDTEVARKYDIPVCNVPAYGTDSVAQH